jgi:AraC-like DNA-binding protein
MARIVMAFAYITMGLLNIIDMYIRSGIDPVMNYNLTKIITLAISLFQAFLFTYTIITLINVQFCTRRKIIRELIPIVLFCVLSFIVLSEKPTRLFNIVFYSFVVYYAFSLVRYTILFVRNYKQYKKQGANFPKQESRMLRWVVIAFFLALAIGIMAFLTLFTSQLWVLLFTLVHIPFYIYFGIQFINYGLIFQKIRSIVAPNEETEPYVRTFHQIERALVKWKNEKHFIKQGIKIDQLAAEIGTNRTYLSNYFNTYQKKTFREWINELRIQDAKILLMKYPDTPVNEIGFQMGYTDKSNFGRQFVKITGLSPQAWREQENKSLKKS